MSVRRHLQVVRLAPEHRAAYLRLHEAVWPDVLARLSASGFRNYSIFERAGMLFAYFEYIGADYAADTAAIAADSATQAWWRLTDPCQAPLDGTDPGSLWADATEIFHLA